MATIEPRLMHLLNVADKDPALPPMQPFPFASPSTTGPADSASTSADAAASTSASAVPSFGTSALASTFHPIHLASFPVTLLPPPDVDPRLSAAALKKIPPFWSLPADENILLPRQLGARGAGAGANGLQDEPNLLPKESSAGRTGAGLAGPPSSATSHGAATNPAAKLSGYPHTLHAPVEAPPADTAAPTNNNASLLSLRMLISDIPSAIAVVDEFTPAPAPLTDDPTTKKRVAKDDFVQLPQPLKKQKSTQQVVPPIINGLHEPPPNAAVFPPMQQSQPRRSPSEPSPAGGAAAFDESEAANVAAAKNLNAILKDFPLAIGGGNGAGSCGLAVEELPVNSAGGSLLSPTTAVSSWAGADAAGGPVQAASPSDADVEGKTTDGVAGKAGAKRRAPRPRRKWTDEETNSLLLGVSRWGVGKWRNILEDVDFRDKFNDRSAGDLKDRFRTCCPDELRGGSGKSKENKINGQSKDHRQPQLGTLDPALTPTPEGPKSNRRKIDFLHRENILIDLDEQAVERDKDGSHSPSITAATPTTEHHQEDSDSAAATTPSSALAPAAPKPRKSRAHRKKMEDLKELGICAPFKKSHRRERRPFSEEDDAAILRGLHMYGPAWTKIQRDPCFAGLLSSRQPTDLRDRVRNKYPETYAMIEKGHWPVPKASGGGGSGGGSAKGGSGGSSRGPRKGHTPSNSADYLLEQLPGGSTMVDNTTMKALREGPSRPLSSSTTTTTTPITTAKASLSDAPPPAKAVRLILLEKSSNESMLSCDTDTNSGSATSLVVPGAARESSEYLPAGGSMAGGGAMAATPSTGLVVADGAGGAASSGYGHSHGHGHGGMDISRLLLDE